MNDRLLNVAGQLYAAFERSEEGAVSEHCSGALLRREALELKTDKMGGVLL